MRDTGVIGAPGTVGIEAAYAGVSWKSVIWGHMISAVGVNELEDTWVWEVAVLRMKWYRSGKSKKNLGR